MMKLWYLLKDARCKASTINCTSARDCIEVENEIRNHLELSLYHKNTYTGAGALVLQRRHKTVTTNKHFGYALILFVLRHNPRLTINLYNYLRTRNLINVLTLSDSAN